ncbi:hypothetical protein HK096_010861, partial [Nowakowskiella sp. JEL0078]
DSFQEPKALMNQSGFRGVLAAEDEGETLFRASIKEKTVDQTLANKLTKLFKNMEHSTPKNNRMYQEGWNSYVSPNRHVLSDSCLEAALAIPDELSIIPKLYPYQYRLIELKGFTVCPALQHAKFDALAQIRYKFLKLGLQRFIQAKTNPMISKMTIEKVSNEILKKLPFSKSESIHIYQIPNKCILVHTIEATALKIVELVTSKMNQFFDRNDILRFACYSAAKGNTNYAEILESQIPSEYSSMLVSIHPKSYFTFLDFNTNSKDLQFIREVDWCMNYFFEPKSHYEIITPKIGQKNYRLAYLIMGYRRWENIAILLQGIFSKDVLIGIHIDRD